MAIKKVKEDKDKDRKNKNAEKSDKGLYISAYLTSGVVSLIRNILKEGGIMPSDESVKDFARLLLKEDRIRQVDREELYAEMGKNEPMYNKYIKEITRLSQDISKIRDALYPDVEKYQEPPRIKLLRATSDFTATLEQSQNGESDTFRVLYELANVIYYNTLDYLQDHDERSYNAIIELFCERAGVDVDNGFNACIAKFTCRVNNNDLKQRDRDKAFALEIEAIKKTVELS